MLAEVIKSRDLRRRCGLRRIVVGECGGLVR